ncbi:SRPBCC family protein [Streptomyces cinereospinus]|uniref:SRPBCC family protein n=1 Tax=Streptomyces cinereospinus TaxID=285561 RepID=A0ABV5N646_9ACTN
MGHLTLHATGPAAPETVWRRYARVDEWASWSPQVKTVQAADRRLRAGLRGTVQSPVGIRAAFVVEAVDHDRRTWAWRVRLGPVRLRLHHEVRAHARGSTTSLTMTGPRLAVLAYAPLAHLALRRLVRP